MLLLCLEPISNNCTRSSLIPQPVLTLFIRHGLRSEHCSPNPSGLCPPVPVAQLSWLSPPHKILWEKSDSSLWKAWKTELEYIYCVSVSPVANATLIHKRHSQWKTDKRSCRCAHSYTSENTPEKCTMVLYNASFIHKSKHAQISNQENVCEFGGWKWKPGPHRLLFKVRKAITERREINVDNAINRKR